MDTKDRTHINAITNPKCTTHHKLLQEKQQKQAQYIQF